MSLQVDRQSIKLLTIASKHTLSSRGKRIETKRVSPPTLHSRQGFLKVVLCVEQNDRARPVRTTWIEKTRLLFIGADRH